MGTTAIEGQNLICRMERQRFRSVTRIHETDAKNATEGNRESKMEFKRLSEEET